MSLDPNELASSTRRYEKATYTPVTTLTKEDVGYQGDALNRSALVRALELTPRELSDLGDSVSDPDQVAAVAAISDATNAVTVEALLGAAARLANLRAGTLTAVGSALKTLRQNSYDSALAQLRKLDARFASAPPPSEPARPPVILPELPAPKTKSKSAKAAKASGPASFGDSVTRKITAASDPAPAPPATALVTVDARVQALVSQRLPDLLAWAQSNQPSALSALRDQLAAAGSSGDVVQLLRESQRRTLLPDLFNGALTRRPLEPVGLLHLERLDMTPTSVERGALVYSLPVAPHEKVTLAHQVWSTTETQFSEYVEDYMENYSEKGVAQSEDIGMSSQTQSEQQNAVTVAQTSANTNAVTVTSPVDGTQSSSVVDDANSQTQSREQTRAVTQMASARTIQDHKVSFTVTTVSGMQDFTARVIDNPRADQSMTVDYFKRMQRWHNRLSRYGARLTYDVVLPDPGQRLRGQILQLQALQSQLATGFEFPLSPSDITPSSYEYYAGQYGVTLEPPPDSSLVLHVTKTLNFPPQQQVKVGNQTWTTSNETDQLDLQIPDGYQLQLMVVGVRCTLWAQANGWATLVVGSQLQSIDNDGNYHINDTRTFDFYGEEAVGLISCGLIAQNVQVGVFDITAQVQATPAKLNGWALAAWGQLRDAAYAAWQAQQAQLRNQVSALQKAIAADDAVTLRQREREEIMRLVLEWLFPGFGDASSVLEDLPNDGPLDIGAWQKVMEYGEYIKFVHSAIDWDRVVVFLYPYFWDVYYRQSIKMFLDHPDQQRRQFLRAGAARVVLAVKPGFEEAVVSLLDQGQLGTIPNAGPRFQKVIADVQAANQKYLATAGAPGENPPIRGIQIAEWHDYTPLGALDVDVTLKKVTVS